MKTLITLLLLTSFALSAQQRGDNTIIIKTKNSFDEAFRQTGQLFVANGLTIDNADRDFGTITTREVRIGRRLDPLWEMKLTAIISGSDQATITLTASARDGDGSWQTLEKRSNMHMMGKGWDQFEEIARKIDGVSITFK